MGGRYYLRAYLRGAEVNASAQLYGWADLADALFRACELAENAGRESHWIIADRIDQVDLVRVDITPRITYLA
jgi:hypothetical protein